MRNRRPVGVILAGGDGRRLGGDKACIELHGETLAERALHSLSQVVDTVVVSCRMGTRLPPLPGIAEAWVQRDDGDAAAGLASALREAGGRPILALAISLPLMSPAVLRELLLTRTDGRPAVLPEIGGRLEPLVGRWEPSALHTLESHARGSGLEAVAGLLAAVRVPFPATDPAFLRVDGPEDLLQAGAILDVRRRQRVRA